jgi:hypothetical protein
MNVLKFLASLLLVTMLLMLAGAPPVVAVGVAGAAGLYNTVAAEFFPQYSLLAVLPVGAIAEQRYGANPGGTTELFVIDVYDLQTLTLPAADSIEVTADLVPVAGKAFAKWDFAQDKGSMSSGIKGEQGSQYVEQGVEAFIPRMTKEIAAVLQNCINRRFIVLKRDANGQVWIYGDKLRPCTFETDYKSGTKFTDVNGTTVKFTAGTTHVPWLYSGDIPLVPTP